MVPCVYLYFHVLTFSLQCLNLTQLLTYYGLNPDSLISPRQFAYLCPALLYQIDRRVCILHYEQMDVEQEAFEPASSGKSKLIDLLGKKNHIARRNINFNECQLLSSVHGAHFILISFFWMTKCS